MHIFETKTQIPTLTQKREALAGINNGWGYTCRPPSVTTAGWDTDCWIIYIGNNWHKTVAKVPI